MECLTRNIFGDDTDHDADLGIIKGFFTIAGLGQLYDNSINCGRTLTNFFEGVGCITSNKLLDTGADQNQRSESSDFSTEVLLLMIGAVVIIGQDQLPWQRFCSLSASILSVCFSFITLRTKLHSVL